MPTAGPGYPEQSRGRMVGPARSTARRALDRPRLRRRVETGRYHPGRGLMSAVADVETPGMSPSRHLRIRPPPMKPTPVTMPANAWRLDCPVTAAAEAAADSL